MTTILQKDNPFKSLRIHHNLSQREVAEHSQVGAQVVLLNEFGVYHAPNPKILSFFETLGEAPDLMIHDYEEFRIFTRDRALNSVASPLNPFLPLSGPNSTGLNSTGPNSNFGNPPSPGFFNVQSLQAWNKWKRQFALSTVGFCKAVCLQPSIVTSFENSLYARNWNFIKEWLWGG